MEPEINVSRKYASSGKYDQLREELLQKGGLFQDAEFPANYHSLCNHDHGDVTKSYPDCSYVNCTWKRPKEICKNPKFVADGFSRFDLDQGTLGDCWFVAAAAAVAMQETHLAKVIPEGQSFTEGEYAGIFRFNFWHFGEWTEVVIDDRLPYMEFLGLGYLVLTQNQENQAEQVEFWPALLEKAYAKLYGGYHRLVGGKIQDALVDLTGGCGQTVATSTVPYHEMASWIKSPQILLGCSIRELGNTEGLSPKHAYSVTGCLQISLGTESARLLRLRDPRGHTDWNGDWSDGSALWQKVKKEDLVKRGPDRSKTEGEFWISYDDFKRKFDEIALCHLVEDKGAQAWCQKKHLGRWTPSKEQEVIQAKFIKHPQYHLQIKDRAFGHQGDQHDVIVSVMRVRGGLQKCVHDIGFDVFQPQGKTVKDKHDIAKYTDWGKLPGVLPPATKYREVSAYFRATPGDYCIVPKAFQPEEGSYFLIRFVTDGDLHSHEIRE